MCNKVGPKSFAVTVSSTFNSQLFIFSFLYNFISWIKINDTKKKNQDKCSVSQKINKTQMYFFIIPYLGRPWPHNILVNFIWVTPRETEVFVNTLAWVKELGSISLIQKKKHVRLVIFSLGAEGASSTLTSYST